MQDAASLRKLLRAASETLAQRNIDLVIGGHAASGVVSRGGVPHAQLIRSMGDLSAFAREMLARSATSE